MATCIHSSGYCLPLLVYNILEECLTLVASSANLPVVYNAHEAGQVKGYPQTPDIRGARVPEN